MFIGLSAPRDLPWRVSHKGKRMTTRRYGKPTSLGDVLRGCLAKAGLGRRLAQAPVTPDWPRLVGPQIAAVTQPESVTPDGTLFVRVATSAWMNELQLMEPQVMTAVNGGCAGARFKAIRWLLSRMRSIANAKPLTKGKGNWGYLVASIQLLM